MVIRFNEQQCGALQSKCKNVLLPIFLLSACYFPMSAIASQKDDVTDVLRWYVAGGIGYASSSASMDSINRQFNAAGLVAEATALDKSDLAVTAYLGYRFNKHWFIESGYKDVGEVKVNISATYDDELVFFDEVRKIHPESGEGLFVAAGYHFYINEQLSVAPQLGVFDWEGKFRTTNVDELKGRDEISGTDLFFGLNFHYQFNSQWGVGLSWDRIQFDRDESDVIWLSAQYRF